MTPADSATLLLPPIDPARGWGAGNHTSTFESAVVVGFRFAGKQKETLMANDMTELQTEAAVAVAVAAEAPPEPPLAAVISYEELLRLPAGTRRCYQEVCYCTPSRGFFLVGGA